RIEATPLAIPLAQEFHWAGGAQVGANLVLFTVHTDEGVSGYGESICEDPRAVVAHGELMARQLIGRHPGDVEAILQSLWTEGIPAGDLDPGGRVQEELDYFGFL